MEACQPKPRVAKAGGEGWIRTSVRLRGQIYSLLPLTTRPPLQRRGTWPRGPVLSILPTSGRCRGSTRNRGIVGLPAAGAPLFNHSPRMTEIGAGEGNRTLVVSLEGFCSTIELHPRVFGMVEGAGFEPAYSERADLQSAAINHSATPPTETADCRRLDRLPSNQRRTLPRQQRSRRVRP